MKNPERPYVFDDYWDMLDGAGPKLKEIILAEAGESDEITLGELVLLHRKAYPSEA